MKWLKLYTEILDDPKIRLLAFEDRWHYVALLCCKAEGLQDERDGIWERLLRVKLGLAEVEFDSLKKRLIEVCLIDSNWNPTGWDKRQGAKDEKGAERQRKYREKQKKRNVTHNVTATSQVEVEEEYRNIKTNLPTGEPPIPELPVSTFKRPSIEDISGAMLLAGYHNLDPELFFAHYESLGWKTATGAQIEDWRSRITVWAREQPARAKRGQTRQSGTQKETPAERMRRELDESERVIQ